jgi:hypothetical protein
LVDYEEYLKETGGEVSWNTLEHSGTLWNTLEHSGTLWNTLEHSGTLWNTLGTLVVVPLLVSNGTSGGTSDGRLVAPCTCTTD